MVDEYINGVPQTGPPGTVISLPPTNGFKVIGIHVDKDTGHIVIEYEDESE